MEKIFIIIEGASHLNFPVWPQSASYKKTSQPILWHEIRGGPETTS
jgi:hypothetical protein